MIEEEVHVLTLAQSTTWPDVFPGLSGEVNAKLRARGIRSVGGAVRAVRLASGRSASIARVIPRMQLDTVLDREAVHLFLMLQLAADLPSTPASPRPRRTRQRLAEC
jgi:hypothetical protein